jgi:hypothetical protein
LLMRWVEQGVTTTAFLNLNLDASICVRESLFNFRGFLLFSRCLNFIPAEIFMSQLPFPLILFNYSFLHFMCSSSNLQIREVGLMWTIRKRVGKSFSHGILQFSFDINFIILLFPSSSSSFHVINLLVMR